ncbi:hypothetical protein TUM20983_23840 [Mycobacterium antarcticum]|nr:hypothetical protein TUM20983_23840 [Mycolicibacterium sp. TUM20983]
MRAGRVYGSAVASPGVTASRARLIARAYRRFIGLPSLVEPTVHFLLPLNVDDPIAESLNANEPPYRDRMVTGAADRTPNALVPPMIGAR